MKTTTFIISINSKLESSFQPIHNKRMQNTERQISGAIFMGVDALAGRHGYEEGHPEVVELTFKGYSSNYVVVIDLATAEDLKKQLEFIL